ncbi:hypothetical protein [Flavobacterium sp. 25HG05S-40]|uniref:hypothetical protein n=1 Tax=Flavobacterium sp. 25HG05S-40 TaxID=3458682 RepID=UPI004044CA08
MGKIVYELDKLLLARPRMLDYEQFNIEQLNFIKDVVSNYLKPNPVLRKYRPFRKYKELQPKSNNFWNLPWQDILMIRKALSEDNLFEAMNLVYNVSEKEFMLLEILNVFSCLNFITDELAKLNAAEEERLHSELTQEEIDAGAEELQEYGYYNSLKAMCPDLLEQDKYLKLPYTIIFREMAHSKLLSDINKKYQENAARKNKKPS